MVKSFLITASKTTDDRGDDESVASQETAINLERVYKH